MDLYSRAVDKYGNWNSCRHIDNREMASQLNCQDYDTHTNTSERNGHGVCTKYVEASGDGSRGSTDICAICQDSILGPRGLLACGHCYCYHCIARWIEQAHCCPVCKRQTEEVTKAPPLISKPQPPPPETPGSLPRFLSLDAGLDPAGERGRGRFCCPCGRRWQSSNAYAGVRQSCARCRTEVGPGRVTPLGDRLSAGTHRIDLCEMCRLMGRDCSSQHRFTASDLEIFCGTNSYTH